jgi:hypothetical protein
LPGIIWLEGPRRKTWLIIESDLSDRWIMSMKKSDGFKLKNLSFCLEESGLGDQEEKLPSLLNLT